MGDGRFHWLTVHGGDVILLLLLLASIVSVGLFAERVFYFRSRFLRRPAELLARVERADSDDAIDAALNDSPGVETGIVLRALALHPGSRQDFRAAVDGHVAQQRSDWERFVGVFAWISTSAPLAGLLGTVLGLMRAFTDLATAEIPEPTHAFAGVSDALLTTALGIIVAIPAVAFHNYVRLRSRRVAQTVESVESLVAAKSRFEAGREAAADS